MVGSTAGAAQHVGGAPQRLLVDLLEVRLVLVQVGESVAGSSYRGEPLARQVKGVEVLQGVSGWQQIMSSLGN